MGRFLKSFLSALVLSLLLGIAIGTCVRRQAEAPARFIGSLDAPPPGWGGSGSALTAALPRDVGVAGAGVLEAGPDEEQVGEAVQVAHRALGDVVVAS